MSPTATIRLRHTSGLVVVLVVDATVVVVVDTAVVIGATVVVVVLTTSTGVVTSVVHDASRTGSISHFRLTIPTHLQQGKCSRVAL